MNNIIFLALFFSVSLLGITVRAFNQLQEFINFNKVNAIDSLMKCFGRHNNDEFIERITKICENFCSPNKKVVSEYKQVEDFLCNTMDTSCKIVTRQCFKNFHKDLFSFSDRTSNFLVWKVLNDRDKKLIRDTGSKIKVDFENEETSMLQKLASLLNYYQTENDKN
ncbi:uncharacterized protein LOC126894315 isoform X2 [Daktulosphaira vitifoliae]|uniref:uncharacterized protein LOC126894315 isoform X2 n=1 Tax=Daktulosphaira vitifoliae TaxID=58002 RepID=UPI0021AB0963|nr:uncharacterized protein LOC126894315 isoform X2 [Daktulosphaira vitifoliae]